MCYIRNVVYESNVRTLRIRRISQEYGRVFKGPQSLPRQFLFYSNSQNIIGVNLLGNPTPPVVITLLTILYLYTQPINISIVVLLQGVVTRSVRFRRSKSFLRLAKELYNSLYRGFLPPNLIIIVLLLALARAKYILSTLLIITSLYP